MSDILLVIGNKNYSSWSLRAWLALAATGAGFDEELILLDKPDTKEKILRHSGAGKVPVLKVGALTVYDTLSICEYLAERFPAAQLWPEDAEARATARSVSAEMHAGFFALRENMPMNCRASRPGVGMSAEVAADIARITEIWRDCRARFGEGQGGPFLFGAFTVADAMYAPVASRFATYAVDLDPVSAAYRDAVLGWPAMVAWLDAARSEDDVLDGEERR